MGIRSLLLEEVLSKTEANYWDGEVRRRFPLAVFEELEVPLAAVAAPFVEATPYRYVDDTVLNTGLEILSQNEERTFAAVDAHSISLDRGISSLFRKSDTSMNEKHLGHSSAVDIRLIATAFFPEYLRWTEHIYGNLIRLFWACLKSGGVQGSFSLRGCTDHLERKGPVEFRRGYDDRVRNAIAHGDFNFTAIGIEFGESHVTTLTSSEFLRLHDDMVRTSNALAVAILLHWASVLSRIPERFRVPPSLAVRVAAPRIDRPGLRVVDAVTSQLDLVGRQLKVAVELAERSRTLVLGRCLQVAAHIVEAGANGYDQFAVEVMQGEPVSSLVLIDPKTLKELLHEDAPEDRLKEALSGDPMIWYDESVLRSRLRLWTAAFRSTWRVARRQIIQNWHDEGLMIGKGRYYIREVETTSVGGIPRVRVRAILRDPRDADNLTIVKSVLADLVKRGRRQRVKTYDKMEGISFSLRRKPQIVMVDLFRTDGHMRWLTSGGWLAGNVIAVAERTWRGRNPVHVTNPQCVENNVRMRFEIDAEAAERALRDAENLIADIRLKAANRQKRKGS